MFRRAVSTIEGWVIQHFDASIDVDDLMIGAASKPTRSSRTSRLSTYSRYALCSQQVTS